jgi:hypothetical protein
MGTMMNNPIDLNKFLDNEDSATHFRKDINVDTKIICHWLYLLAKVLAIFLLKR